MLEVFESFSVDMPMVTLHELSEIDAALRGANATFTYQIGIREHASFATLPLGYPVDELRVSAEIRDNEGAVPLATLLIRGGGIDAQLHQDNTRCRLWFTTIKCRLLERRVALMDNAPIKSLLDGQQDTAAKVWLVCLPEGTHTLSPKEVSTTTKDPRSFTGVQKFMARLVTPVVLMVLAQLFPGMKPSDLGAFLLVSSASKG